MRLTYQTAKRRGARTVAKKSDCRLAWVSDATARKCCESWHYSKSYPMPKCANVGIWEGTTFVGVIVFGWGGNYRAGEPYGLRIGEVVELVRVAMRPHAVEVSRHIAIALRMLKKQSPGVRLVISYADPVQGHGGSIYKAGGWLYLGQTAPSFEYRVGSRRLQKRAYTGTNYGNPKAMLPRGAIKVDVPGKLKFAMPMDSQMRDLLLPRALPYLKSPSSMNHAPPDHGGEGGVDPTDGLQHTEVDDGATD